MLAEVLLVQAEKITKFAGKSMQREVEVEGARGLASLQGLPA